MIKKIFRKLWPRELVKIILAEIVIGIFKGYGLRNENPYYWEYDNDTKEQKAQRHIETAIADTIENTISNRIEELSNFNNRLWQKIKELPYEDTFILKIIEEINKRQLKK